MVRLRWLFAVVCSCLLTGCLLVSGEHTTIDIQDGGGNLSSSFVSAEGDEQRSVQVGSAADELQVIAIVGIESGDLQLELLQPDGSVAFVVAARPDTQVTRSSTVRSDENGMVLYRVVTRGARNGAYQLFFQP